MIPEKILAQILDVARIEEVIGDVVQLKKRGANYLGRCPFHDEKTPSFTVSPAKGIYKCFGCGAAGNVVKFVMENEHLSYPEAIKFVGRRYNIEVEEIEITPADRLAQQNREGLLIAAKFVANYFSHQLFDNQEGRSIGLSYFKERGFSEDIVRKFELGYALESWDDLLTVAQTSGYSLDLLQQLGLVAEKDGRKFAFFRNRVQFAIHDANGKVVAFAGRTLSKDPKKPKYINSPETEIYHKSKVLYGMHLAKKSIAQHNECLLVEGYTDVISLVQGGIENVVASAGTSLTIEQIRLIRRYTPNITILYDGDAAGIKAALRGIDLVLEEDMNVKIVLLPMPEDPDSYIRKVGKTAFEQYIHSNAKDFVLFKADLLIKEVGDDPVKRTDLIRNIVATVALVPDNIKRQSYAKKCYERIMDAKVLANQQDIDLLMLINEVNKMRLKKHRPQDHNEQHTALTNEQLDYLTNPAGNRLQPIRVQEVVTSCEIYEKELLNVLLEFGSMIYIDDVLLAVYLIHETETLPFNNPNYQKIIALYRQQLENGLVPESDFFINYPNDTQLATTTVNILATPHTISDRWKEKEIFVPTKRDKFKKEMMNLLNRYKLYHVIKMMEDNFVHLKNTHNDDIETLNNLQTKHMQYMQLQVQLCKLLGTTIVR
jgi:DNA primase